MTTLADIQADLKSLITTKNCGPILIRLSWHDAGVYSTGKLTGGEYSSYYMLFIISLSRLINIYNMNLCHLSTPLLINTPNFSSPVSCEYYCVI